MPAHTATWHAQQYDNRARVPDAPEILQRWARQSARVRKALPAQLNLAYGPAPSHTLDVFPARQRGAPVLVFIHGGWWRALDKSDLSFIAPAFVRAGITVVLPNYTLCPHTSIGGIALEMAQALAWVHRHADSLGADAQHITVAGHSAGGHLAAMLACCDFTRVGNDLPPDLLHAAIAVSGVFDLGPIRRTPFLQPDLRLSAADVPRLSPAFFPAPRLPVLALVGGDESAEHRRQNRLLGQRWKLPAQQVLEVAGANHFTVVEDFADVRGVGFPAGLEVMGLG